MCSLAHQATPSSIAVNVCKQGTDHSINTFSQRVWNESPLTHTNNGNGLRHMLKIILYKKCIVELAYSYTVHKVVHVLEIIM